MDASSVGCSHQSQLATRTCRQAKLDRQPAPLNPGRADPRPPTTRYNIRLFIPWLCKFGTRNNSRISRFCLRLQVRPLRGALLPLVAINQAHKVPTQTLLGFSRPPSLISTSGSPDRAQQAERKNRGAPCVKGRKESGNDTFEELYLRVFSCRRSAQCKAAGRYWREVERGPSCCCAARSFSGEGSGRCTAEKQC